MTNKPNAGGKDWRQRLEEHLANVPYLSAEEIRQRKAEQAQRKREEELEVIREHNRKVLQLTPYGGPQGRKWQPYVEGPTSCIQGKPTDLDRVREDVARAAREARMRADPEGTGIWGVGETMADVVRRQDETR
jgi:hypothetical protein